VCGRLPERFARRSRSRSLPAAGDVQTRSVDAALAENIVRLRTAARLSVRELANRAGISASMLSEVERGSKSPTVSLLSYLAGALGVTVSELVETGTERRPRTIVRAEEQHFVEERYGLRRESLGPSVPSSNVEFVRYVLPAHADTGAFKAHRTGTRERVHVENGTVKVVLETDEEVLREGDTIVYFADCSHRFVNLGKRTAVLYLVIESRPEHP
jgi:transcriptional regulator with XRE-family HTH domain